MQKQRHSPWTLGCRLLAPFLLLAFGCQNGPKYVNYVELEGLPKCEWTKRLVHPIALRLEGEDTKIHNVHTGTWGPKFGFVSPPKLGFYRSGDYEISVGFCTPTQPARAVTSNADTCGNVTWLFNKSFHFDHINDEAQIRKSKKLPWSTEGLKLPKGWGDCG